MICVFLRKWVWVCFGTKVVGCNTSASVSNLVHLHLGFAVSFKNIWAVEGKCYYFLFYYKAYKLLIFFGCEAMGCPLNCQAQEQVEAEVQVEVEVQAQAEAVG